MNNRNLGACAVVLTAALLSGCASVTRGTKEKFTIQSTPAGANAELVGLDMKCTTPCTIKLKRKNQFTVKLTKEGYEPVEVAVRGKVKGGGGATGILGNALLGGVIGAVVDGSNGALMDLTPNPVVATMKEVAAAAPSPVPTEAPATTNAPLTTEPAPPAAESAAPVAATSSVSAVTTPVAAAN